MTHSELIKALGGQTKVAERISDLSGQHVDPGAVYRWSKLNSIAWRWRPYVVAMAQERGVAVPGDFLPGLPDAPQHDGAAA